MGSVQIRKAVIFSFKTCFRSVGRHPFLVGWVFVLILLYRFFPLVFSLLVCASPVFVSTAALLGTLLTYGQPNIPSETQKEEEKENVCQNSVGVPRNSMKLKRDGSFDNVERFNEIRRDVVEKTIEEASSTAVGKNVNNVISVKEKSKEFKEKQGSGAERVLSDTLFDKRDNLTDLKRADNRRQTNQYYPFRQSPKKSRDQVEKVKSPERYVGFEKIDLSSPRGSPRKQEDNVGFEQVDRSSPRGSRRKHEDDVGFEKVDRSSPRVSRLKHEDNVVFEKVDRSSPRASRWKQEDNDGFEKVDWSSPRGSRRKQEDNVGFEKVDWSSPRGSRRKQEDNVGFEKVDRSSPRRSRWKQEDVSFEKVNRSSPRGSHWKEEDNVGFEKVDQSSPRGSRWKKEDKAEESDGYVSFEQVDRSSPRGSHQKQEDKGEESDADNDDVSDSGSDGAESLSPDASEADIIPMLDEVQPLLDGDAPQPAHTSNEVSDVVSDISSKTDTDSSNEIDAAMEKREEELELATEEEETNTDREDETKNAIRWTEDDQKNVMNLGSSELERNQRLENLIATRSLRKTMKYMAQKNLIDLEGTDLPFKVAPISTRQNPFYLHNDSISNMGLPGSAPSIMAQRRNPFELLYDPGEEKSAPLGDDSDHVQLQPKDPLFRRNETFNAGPSYSGTSRHDYNFRTNFVLEQISPEKPSSSSLHRQSSLHSESKASSGPETESLGSVEEMEDHKTVEKDLSEEPVVRTMAENPSEHVGHGSESSDDDDPTQVETKDAAQPEIEVDSADVEEHKGKLSSVSVTAGATNHTEGDASETNEVVEPDDSSSTSLSEEHENVFNENKEQHQNHMESSDAENTIHSVDDTQHKEPIYDSSPTAHHPPSSLSSDQQVEIVESDSSPVLVPSITENDSDVSNQINDENTPDAEADEKLVSSHQSASENWKKEMTVSDQSVVDEPSPEKHKELQESAKSLNASELQGVDKEIQSNINSPTTSEPNSTQSEILETKKPQDRADSVDTGGDAVSNENRSELSGSIQDGHAENHHEEAATHPDSDNYDREQSGSKTQVETSPHVHDGDIRDTDGTNVVSAQTSEGNQESLPKSENRKESSDFEVDEESSHNTVKSNTEVSGEEAHSKVSEAEVSSKSVVESSSANPETAAESS